MQTGKHPNCIFFCPLFDYYFETARMVMNNISKHLIPFHYYYHDNYTGENKLVSGIRTFCIKQCFGTFDKLMRYLELIIHGINEHLFHSNNDKIRDIKADGYSLEINTPHIIVLFGIIQLFLTFYKIYHLDRKALNKILLLTKLLCRKIGLLKNSNFDKKFEYTLLKLICLDILVRCNLRMLAIENCSVKNVGKRFIQSLSTIAIECHMNQKDIKNYNEKYLNSNVMGGSSLFMESSLMNVIRRKIRFNTTTNKIIKTTFNCGDLSGEFVTNYLRLVKQHHDIETRATMIRNLQSQGKQIIIMMNHLGLINSKYVKCLDLNQQTILPPRKYSHLMHNLIQGKRCQHCLRAGDRLQYVTARSLLYGKKRNPMRDCIEGAFIANHQGPDFHHVSYHSKIYFCSKKHLKFIYKYKDLYPSFNWVDCYCDGFRECIHDTPAKKKFKHGTIFVSIIEDTCEV